MEKSVEASRGELATVRTGRASPHLLDRIVVDYYGAATPLKQLANISASDARLLTVTPFDASSIGAIEKAINESDVGLIAEQRRQRDPPADPGDDRGPQARDGQGRQRRRRGGPGRGPQRAPRRDARPARTEEGGRSRRGRRAPRRDAPCRSRPTRRSPRSTLSSRERKRRSSRCECLRAARSDHHRRQRALGTAARAAGHRGPPGRRRRRQGTPPRRRRARDRGAHRLLLLDRELVAAARTRSRA